jgi:hypothetical protein
MPLQPPGTGSILTIPLTAPAAGANLSYAIPAGCRWTFHGVWVTFGTDANVANRDLYLKFVPATGGNMAAASGITQTASTTRNYYFVPGISVTTSISTLHNVMPLPYPIIMNGADTFSVTILGIQATDQISAAVLIVMETIEI